MRTLAGPAAAALNSPTVAMAALVEMELSSPLRLCSGGWVLTWAGDTYTPFGDLGTVQPVEETTGAPPKVNFQLSGVPASLLSLALSEPVQGKPVSIRIAIFDPDTYQILDAPVEWEGTLDVMTIQESREGSVISVTAETAWLDLLRSAPVRFTDVDQQRLFPGDRGLEYVTDTAEQVIIWPARSFFER